MKNRNQKIFVFVAIGFVVVGFIYSFNSNTVFSQFFESFTPVNWDEVHEREIVKNSMPVYLIESIDGSCKVNAEKFFMIVDHEPFIRSKELVDKLQFDRENHTIVLPCGELVGEKSRLNVWYVTEESAKHATKYDYFITPWNETKTDK